MPANPVPIDVKTKGQTWLLPPYNWSHRRIAKELDVSPSVVSKWRNELVESGQLSTEPPLENTTTDYSAEQRFFIVIETATMSERELAEYCRSKGLFVDDVKTWRALSIKAQSTTSASMSHKENKLLRDERRKVKALEKELARKDKALAETAALLVLREKFQCPLGNQRGRLTPISERLKIVTLVDEAVRKGATKTKACSTVGLSIRTFQRWTRNSAEITSDMRQHPRQHEPHNKLSEAERQQILDICNTPEYADLPPNIIVPMLADEGIYIASESTFYRVLKANNQLGKRTRNQAGTSPSRPKVQKACKPNQVWSWDISYLPSKIRGKHYYLYLIMDIFSRKVVGAEVYDQDLGEYAAELLQRTTWREKCVQGNITLHSDNGAPMRIYTMLAKMYDLGIVSSYSRPRVSNDNPYSESLFKTIKYCPSWPMDGFSSIEDARCWVGNFVDWYNNEHKHSGIKYVTPQQRHCGEDNEILRQRMQVYRRAQLTHPGRWSRQTRDWSYIDEVYLNPEKCAA
ncbi:IS3 family transposase [Vibrio cidicii]